MVSPITPLIKALFIPDKAQGLTMAIGPCYAARSFQPGRGVAQPGSALAWGARGHEFNSRRPDHLLSWPRIPSGK